MEIQLFGNITTETELQKLEADGVKYTGLFVDMDNTEERKYVKDSAALISGMIKKLDRARINKTKAYKVSIEAEAASIKSRLEEANKPFTLLIDEHKVKRANILAAKKAKEDAVALVIQIDSDHEQALMMDKVQMFEKAERERLQKERDQEIANKAVEAALQAKASQEAYEKDLAERERLLRKSDIEHKTVVNNKALESLVGISGITDEQAKAIVKLIVKGLVPNVSIHY